MVCAQSRTQDWRYQSNQSDGTVVKTARLNVELDQVKSTEDMKLKSYDSFQIEGSKLVLAILVAASVAEYDQLAKQDGAALESAVDNVVYRSVLADFRAVFCEKLEEQLTKEFPGHDELKRKLKELPPKKGSTEPRWKFDEAEAEYVRRVLPLLATLRGVDEVKIESFQSLVDEITQMTENNADGSPLLDEEGNPLKYLRFDPSAPERKERGPKTLPKKYLEAGKSIVNDGAAEAFFSHYGVTFTPPEGEGVTEEKVQLAKAEAIGWKIKALEDAEAAKTNLTAKYAVPAAA